MGGREGIKTNSVNMKFNKYIISTLFVIGFEFIIFILGVVAISLIKPDEHAFTCVAFGFLAALMSLPFMIVASFVHLKFKIVIIPITTFGSIAISLLTYFHNSSPEQAFKRIVISPIPSSVAIINVKVNDVITFFEFKCNKDDMKKILNINKYEKTKTKHYWGDQTPKWLDQQNLENDYELLIEESIGSWIRAIYVNKDSTKAFYVMSWY